jgi:ATP-dependent Clp protease ATP-binding subunit ClpA
VFQKLVQDPLATMILNGTVKPGSKVRVECQNNDIVLKTG